MKLRRWALLLISGVMACSPAIEMSPVTGPVDGTTSSALSTVTGSNGSPVSSTVTTRSVGCSILRHGSFDAGGLARPVLLDGVVYSLDPAAATLALVPSQLGAEPVQSIATVGNDIYAVVGHPDYRVINVLTGTEVDLSQIPGEPHRLGAGVGDLLVVVGREEFAFRDEVRPLAHVLALDPASGDVKWSWTAFMGDPEVGSGYEALLVLSIRQNPTRDRIVVHTLGDEAIALLAVLLDEAGSVLSGWPPPPHTTDPTLMSDNLSLPAFVGVNAGWFDSDFLLYDRLPDEPRLRLVDPINGQTRYLGFASMSNDGIYLPVGDGNHLLHWDGENLGLVSTLESNPDVPLATRCASVITEQTTSALRPARPS